MGGQVDSRGPLTDLKTSPSVGSPRMCVDNPESTISKSILQEQTEKTKKLLKVLSPQRRRGARGASRVISPRKSLRPREFKSPKLICCRHQQTHSYQRDLLLPKRKEKEVITQKEFQVPSGLALSFYNATIHSINIRFILGRSLLTENICLWICLNLLITPAVASMKNMLQGNLPTVWNRDWQFMTKAQRPSRAVWMHQLSQWQGTLAGWQADWRETSSNTEHRSRWRNRTSGMWRQ